MIGAGGAARAVVHALMTSGARVLVLNRTAERGRRLAAELLRAYAGLDEPGYAAARDHADLIVQTTSVGMAPTTLADSGARAQFTGAEIVYELVYTPPITPFLRRALTRAAGW